MSTSFSARCRAQNLHGILQLVDAEKRLVRVLKFMESVVAVDEVAKGIPASDTIDVDDSRKSAIWSM